MNAVRFEVMFTGEKAIPLPEGIQLSPGLAEVIILQPTETPAKPPAGEHLIDRLTHAFELAQVSPDAFPTDLAENHDHYAHGAPRKTDPQ